jgi:uncharacterized membrane protein YraQ (UPF0718 family)
VVIGLLMHVIFLRDEKNRTTESGFALPEEEDTERSIWQTALFFFTLVAIIVFLNWTHDERTPLWNSIFRMKYFITGAFLIFLLYMALSWFKRDELREWVDSTWGFAKQILPLLFAGVMAAGFFLGRPGHEGIIASKWISRLVGGNSLRANLFASLVGALMYFATLTEVPILQGLLGSGMGHGPALALLLAGPALSLPNMLVIRSVLGTKKTIVYVLLVVIMATFSGMLFGEFFSNR